MATPTEIIDIIDRMATAPFDPAIARVPLAERGLTYGGHTLGAQEPSLRYYLFKRV